MFALLSTVFSLRNVLLLFCLLNLKNLPLAWELRLLYRGWRSWRSKRDVARILDTAASRASSDSKAPASSHPLFAPLTISSRTPLLEIDHNIHKSNSTYFSDLDESRTALVVHLLSSTKFSPAELDKAGYKGAFAVILGSVHTSFLKEIKAYERYEVRSRVLSWDQKWIIIGSVFVRPKNAKDRIREAKVEGKSEAENNTQQDEHDSGEILLATCLSKYVVKKGRFTVSPERCWISAGWMPEKPADRTTPPVVVDSSAAMTPDMEQIDGAVGLTAADLRRRAQETAAKAAEKLKEDQNNGAEEKLSKADEACRQAASNWSWDDIEAERTRGMKIAENWLGLDRSLREQWEEDFARGIGR
ncbi:hypothetical protein OHC33_008896 [Knufia fluminis]|uniref:Uncharacterized protein n=1 Tax=Knufia fluminis TaxID=191047 RepID=A0AAN8I5A8_9EURO|nr:hypothetical protein OHC33_008896 [Knufia fluminis]